MTNTATASTVEDAKKEPKANLDKTGNKLNPKEKKEYILPRVTRPSFKLQRAAYRTHNAIIPAGLKNPELNLGKSDLWHFVAGDIQQGDEIRCQDEDGKYVAYLYVTFCHGRKVMAKVLSLHNLEDDVKSLETFQNGRYDVCQKGPLKWCIIDTKTGEKIRQGIQTRASAFKELDEFLKRFDD